MISSLGGGVYYWGSANGLQGEFTSYQANSISTSNTVTYYAGYGFNDPNSTVTGVSLTKGTTTVQGTSATSSLGGKQWSAFMTLGTSVPTQATYTAAISGVPSKTISFTLPNAASTNGSVGMPNFPTAVYPNASSSVSSSSPLVISWTPPTSAPANTVYQIAVNSSNGNNLWTTFVPAGSTSSLTYGGSALTPSTNYQVQVTAQVVDVFSNVTFNASRIETFCYGCTSNLQPQTINLNVGTVGTVGVSMPVTASSSSNLAVSLSTGTPQVCAFSTTGTNNTLTFSSEGTCEVNASQAGNGTYQSASVRKTITVTKVDPTDPIGPGWTPLAAPGTPGYGGVIRSNYRSADGRLWVAVDGAGLYASSDEGVNWTPMNNGIVNKRAWGVYTEAANASGVYKVWAVTNGGGVYVSSDSGASFTAKNNGLTCTFLRSIRFVGTRVFVATDFCGDNNSGVFYSDNGGDTWTRSTGLGATALRVNSISNINPTSAITYLLANTSNGIYKSTDNGVSWAALPTSPSGPNGNIVYGTSYSYDASKTPALRLISTVEGAGIFVSDDAGATWVAKKTGMPSGSLVPMSSATSDGTANNWFVALDRFGLYRSTDRGESWTLMANDAVLPSPRFIAKYPASAAGYTFYAATLAGPYASADGVNWIKGGAGLPGGTVNNVVFDNAGVAYAGAADGAYRFDSETKQWVKLPGLPAMDQGHLLARGNDIYASTNSYGVYKLTNGTQWTPMNTGLPTNLVYKTPKLRNDLSVDNAFYAGLYGDGVYYFDGTTWSAKNGNITATNEKKVRFLTSSGPQVLMTSEGNMYLSTDRGANWTQVGPTDSTTNTKVRMLHATIDPQNPSVMFASAYNTDWTNQNLSTNGVWKTTDKGTTWTKITSDKLPPQKIYDVRVINTGDAYIVTAAAWDDDTKRGLWISQDGGNNWQQFSTGLGSAYPAGVFVTPNSQGYVASVGNGIYSFNSGSSNNDWRYFGTYIDRTPGANGSTYYNVSYGLDDPNKTFSALTLTNGSTSTAGQYDGKQWNVNLNLGSSAPAPSTTYTALLTPSGGGTPKAVNFSIGTQGWNTTAPTNLAITTTSGGGSGGAATIITWSPPTNATANTTYNVALNDVSNNGYNQVWGIQLGLGAATSVTYSGPSLSSGKQYQVVVTAQSPDVIANIGYGASAAMAYTVGASTQLQPQSVSITPVTAAAVVGASANLSATATSGLAVSFYSNSQLVCVVNGNTLNYIAPGLCSISAVQPGNPTYQPASASLTLNVNNTQGPVTGTTAQTITFTPISSLSVGGTASLSATTTAAGLSVSFNSQTPTTCAVSGSTVTGVNSGICALQATQSGSATYAPAVASQYLSVSAGSGSSTTSPTTTTTQVLNTSVSLSSGWNLMGNGFNFNIDVPQIFGNPSQFTTVWKWVTSTSKWAFYAPSLNADALATYAAGKGYDVLTTINPGEGFWVNSSAEQAVELRSDTTQVPAAFTSSNLAIGGPNELQSGSWNLVAIGDKKTPAQFNTSINPLAAPPSAGSSSIAENLTTLWAWDAPSAKWYFYAPRLQNTSSTALESYIASKNYLGFGTMQLSPSTGFWVNVP